MQDNKDGSKKVKLLQLLRVIALHFIQLRATGDHNLGYFCYSTVSL